MLIKLGGLASLVHGLVLHGLNERYPAGHCTERLNHAGYSRKASAHHAICCDGNGMALHTNLRRHGLINKQHVAAHIYSFISL